MVNHLVFQGRLVADPTFGTTNGGMDYVNFRLAWSEKYKEKENKCFLECKAFGATAKFVSAYFKKGQEMVSEGKLNTDEWTTDDGQKRSKIVLMVSGVHFCGKKQENGEAASAEPSGYTPVETESLPF